MRIVDFKEFTSLYMKPIDKDGVFVALFNIGSHLDLISLVFFCVLFLVV